MNRREILFGAAVVAAAGVVPVAALAKPVAEAIVPPMTSCMLDPGWIRVGPTFFARLTKVFGVPGCELKTLALRIDEHQWLFDLKRFAEWVGGVPMPEYASMGSPPPSGLLPVDIRALAA